MGSPGDPHFLFCFAFLHNHHRPRTRKPRLPSTGDFWERPQCSRTRPATQRGQKRTSSREHLEQLLPLRPGPPVEGWRHPQPSEWVLPSVWLRRRPRTMRTSGAHFKGIEKNLFPDLQRICSAYARSSISESSNSSTIPLKVVARRGQ